MHSLPAARIETLPLDVLRRRRTEKWNAYPSDVLPAWVAEMDFAVAPSIAVVLREVAQDNDFGYPLSRAKREVAECFVERMQHRFTWAVREERVEVLSDVVQGLYLCLAAFSRPGDGVVIQPPIYPPFLGSVSEMKRRAVLRPLHPFEGGWGIDWAQLEDDAARTARLVLLCNPHNPTGRVFQRTELERLAELALDRNWLVVSDEIHADLTYPDNVFIPFGSLAPEVAERTITLTSATKAFNIPGLRCAVAYFGSDQLWQRFNDAFPRHLRGGLSVPGLRATASAWKDAQAWLDELVRVLDQNKQLLLDSVSRDLQGLSIRAPEATYLAWLDCTRLALPTSPARFFLDNAKVALSDGRHFGAGFEQFVRLNFATSRSLLTEILQRMRQALAQRR